MSPENLLFVKIIDSRLTGAIVCFFQSNGGTAGNGILSKCLVQHFSNIKKVSISKKLKKTHKFYSKKIHEKFRECRKILKMQKKSGKCK
jgi:hypothetical protein